MKFFLIIGNNALHTYERDGQHLKPQFIEGSDAFAIRSTNVCEDVKSYMDILENEKNLGTIAELDFEVLECADSNLSAGIITALGEHVDKVYALEDALKTVIKKLLRDKKLMIDTYGINYDGQSYKVDNNDIIQGDYDLLGYTVHCDDMVGFMDL